MPKLRLTGVYPEDLDAEDTYRIPEGVTEIGNCILFPLFCDEKVKKEKIRFEITHPVEYIGKHAFSYRDNSYVEVHITAEVSNLTSECFSSVSKLAIPSLTKAYKGKRILCGNVGEILTVVIADIGETYRFLRVDYNTTVIVTGEVTMKNGVLYTGYPFTGSLSPRKPETVCVFVINKDKRDKFGYKVTHVSDDLESLKKKLTDNGLI